MSESPASVRKDRCDRPLPGGDVLEEIFTAGPAVIYVTDVDGDHGAQYVSPNIEGLTGYAPGDCIGDPDFWKSNIHPDDAPRIHDGYGALFARGHHVHEYRFRRRDGSYIWIRDELKVIRAKDGTPEKLIGFWTDIDERKAMDEALRRSEASLANAQRIARLGNWDWNLTDGTLYWSDEIYRIFGLQDLGFGGSFEAFLERVHPDDRAMVEKAVTDALESGAAYDIDHRIVLPDGRVRIVHELAEIVRDDADRPLRMNGTAHDVTEHYQAVETLRESANQMRLIADAIPAVIYYADKKLRYRFANKQAEYWLARPSTELCGQGMETVLGEELATVLRPYWTRALAGETVTFDRTVTSPDGTERQVQVTYVPHVTERGGVAGFFGVVLDQTESKAIEESLRQTVKMEALGALTGGVAHEFNNLLQAISSSLFLLKRKTSEVEHLDEIFEIAEHATQRGADLTYRLLSYVGKRPINPVITDTAEAIVGAMRLLRPVLRETIEIERRVDPGLWPVLVDRAQFESAIFNIAVNSRDAIPNIGKITIAAGNVTLGEDFHAGEEIGFVPGDYVRISITDTGTGMPADVAAHAFDPFFTTKEVGQGTGLGLSMVYGFVRRQSGGYVDIDTKLGQGTTVTIYLPRARSAAADRDAGAAKPARRSGFEEVARATILVAEDDEQVRASVKLQLEGMGLRVVAVQNGAEAYEVFERVRYFDLLLTDAVMPGGPTGFELARAVRRLSKATRVIVMTGYTDDTLPIDREAGRGTRILQKPFTAETLGKAVTEALELGQ